MNRENLEQVLSRDGIERLRKQIFNSVRSACPAWLASQAEDIVQSTLIRLVRHLEERGGILGLNPSYVHRAAYNAIVDEIRRQFRRAEREPGERDGIENVIADEPRPDREVAALEIQEGIRDCLSEMIRPRRAAVACHLMGYSVPEACRFLGWTKKKTEHLVRRGLADLRSCLDGKGLAP